MGSAQSLPAPASHPCSTKAATEQHTVHVRWFASPAHARTPRDREADHSQVAVARVQNTVHTLTDQEGLSPVPLAGVYP